MNVYESQAGAKALAEFVERGGVSVLTGAGLSTESGIPDYRRRDGTRRTVPMTFQEFMRSEEARKRYWIRSTVGWQRFAAAEPNSGHRAVAQWQKAGLLRALITQNVDGLHARAGARDVVELHGNLDTVRCMQCDGRFDRAEFQRVLAALNPLLPTAVELLADGDAEVPQHLEAEFLLAPCPRCHSTVVKPDVVMFGESVEAGIVADCFSSVAASRALLVLGSSLRVMSGYRFVLAARKAGTPVALVGLGEMRGQEEVDLLIKAPLGSVLTAATAHLLGTT